MNGVEEEAEEGEVDSSAPVKTKVHIRGLDQLNTNDIQQYVEEHYTTDLLKKIEWVDDTSANLIYDTEEAAAEALMAFSEEQVSWALYLRQAKKLSTRPDIELQVRQAMVSDVKVVNAKDQSRFYLFNPEWDPDNRNRKRRRPAGGYVGNKYRRRDSWEDSGRHRRQSREEPQFHEDMYDDAPTNTGVERRTSYSSGGEYAKRGRVHNEDLFAGRQNVRLRNRSASPTRDGDGRYGFDEDHPLRPTARARSRTPPEVRAGRDNCGTRDNLRKELFPDRRGSSAFANGHSNNNPRELFPNRPSSSSSGRELFPDKLNGSVHRRREAQDIHPDEVADAIGKYSIGGSNEYFTYGKPGQRPEYSERREREAGRDLFSRITGGPKIESTYGRLQEHSPDRSEDVGFSIKGAGETTTREGYSIKGASRSGPNNPLLKELFPKKAGGGGKDLFDGRIKGRGPTRDRAEDLF